MNPGNRKIRVLVVDDSAVMRKLIPSLLAKDDEIEVVATAIDGDFAISKIDQFHPDVITLDVDMPRMDGITALGLIVPKHAIPVLMLSSLTTRDAALTMKALEMGAVDFICKPRGNSRIGEMGDELVSKVKAAARGRLIAPAVIPPPVARPKRPLAPLPLRTASEKLVAIGASSGGPNALRFLLPRIPADFDAGIVVVQHMPESFTAVMAKWLDEICEVEVKEASDGDIALPGRVFIAPGSAHMKIRRSAQGPVVELDRGGPVNGHRPSVDVLFWSVAAQYGKRAAAVLMTGMGSDGAEGIGEIRRAGGMTLAQDKETSAIFGMPRAAIERGYVEKVAPLAEIAPWLINMVGRSQSSEGAQDGKHN